MDVDALYYQYLINNNYTSNMFKSLSGASSLNSVDSVNGISSLLGTDGISSIFGGGLTGTTGVDFLSVLQSVIGNSAVEQTVYSDWADKLSDVIEEQKGTETTLSKESLQTVQDLYDFFQKASYSTGGVNKVLSGDSTETTSKNNTGSTANTGISAAVQTQIAQAENAISEIESMFAGTAMEDSLEAGLATAYVK